jgi:hypothetical protein
VIVSKELWCWCSIVNIPKPEQRAQKQILTYMEALLMTETVLNTKAIKQSISGASCSFEKIKLNPYGTPYTKIFPR